MELHTLKWLFQLGDLPTHWGWLAVTSQDRGLLFPVRLLSVRETLHNSGLGVPVANCPQGVT